MKKDLKCGICGEHGGDPDSIKFCQKVGLDYVSCSPFRVPIARLAAAQAALREAAVKHSVPRSQIAGRDVQLYPAIFSASTSDRSFDPRVLLLVADDADRRAGRGAAFLDEAARVVAEEERAETPRRDRR